MKMSAKNTRGSADENSCRVVFSSVNSEISCCKITLRAVNLCPKRAEQSIYVIGIKSNVYLSERITYENSNLWCRSNQECL
jgi:hypothetical protein